MTELKYIPIDDAAKDGERRLVRRGPSIAAAYWTGDMWAYRGTREQIDFEPTHYAAGLEEEVQ